MSNKLFIILCLQILVAQSGEKDDWLNGINLDDLFEIDQFNPQEIGSDINATYLYPQAGSGTDIFYTAAPSPTLPPLTGSSFNGSQASTSTAPAPTPTPVALDPFHRSQASFTISGSRPETAIYQEGNDLIYTRLDKEDGNTYCLFNTLQISSEIDSIFISGARLKVEDSFVQSLTDSINEGTRETVNLFSIHPNGDNAIQLNKVQTLVRFFFIIDQIQSKLAPKSKSSSINHITLSNIFLYVADSFNSWAPQRIGDFLAAVETKLLDQAKIIKKRITDLQNTPFSKKMVIRKPQAYSSFCISLANNLQKHLETSHPAFYEGVMERRPFSKLTTKVLNKFICDLNNKNTTRSEQLSASTCTSPTAADPRIAPAIQVENILGKRSLPEVEISSFSEPSFKRPRTERDHNISPAQIEDLKSGLLAEIDMNEERYARTGQFIKRSDQFKAYYLKLTDPSIIKKISYYYEVAIANGIHESFFLFILQNTSNLGATRPGEEPVNLNCDYISYLDHLIKRERLRYFLRCISTNSPTIPKEILEKCSNNIHRLRDILENIDMSIEELVITRGYPFSPYSTSLELMGRD